MSRTYRLSIALCLSCASENQDSTDQASAWLSLSIAEKVACGADAQHAVVCWGDGDPEGWGEDKVLGGPAATLDASDVAVDRIIACALRADGGATCWGGRTFEHPGPSAALALGGSLLLVLEPSGRLECSDTWLSTTCPDFTPLDGVASFVASSYHVLAVGLDGELQFQRLTEYTAINPTLPPGPWRQVSLIGHDDWICGIRESGELSCWGEWGDGLGLATPPAGTYTDLCMSWRGGACALDDAGEPACWGDASRYPPAAGPFTQLTCGFDTWCGLTAEGAATCWGACDGGVCDLPE